MDFPPKEEIDLFQTQLKELDYVTIYKEFSSYENKMIQYSIRSCNWRVQPSIYLVDLKLMSNVSYICVQDFSGCEFSIQISESKSGPYIDIYKKKYFTKSKEKKINLYTLPCRYIRLQCTKGKFDIKNMRLIGFYSEDIEKFLGKNTFSLLVNQPQKILYDI